jgi:predicted aldo/keto reductase-like oxidoreductase
MEKRFFKGIGREISLLGFGLMRLPLRSADAGDIDRETAEGMVGRAIEGGVNYFDTGVFYHEGKSEVFAGDILSKHPRGSYNLAAKMPPWMVQSPGDPERMFEEQLKRCRVGYFDFYLIHNMSGDSFDLVRKNRIYEFLRKKKDQGVIRRLGFSIHDSPAKLKQVLEDYDWDIAQIQLNYLDWETMDARGQYELLAGRGVPIVVMEPVRGGTLATLSAPAADILKKHDPDATPASWAIRYAASLPGVMTVLSGMSAPEQLEDNLKTLSAFRPLSDAERAILDRAITVFRASGVVPCTGCRYCMTCPSGVDIPRVFAVYNHYRTLPSDQPGLGAFVFGNGYRSMAESERAHNCVNCGQCAEHCPQKIDIPRFIREIADFAASVH